MSDFNFTSPLYNSTEAIKAIINMFNKAPGYNESYYYNSILTHGPSGHSPIDSISTAIRFLIHYVGDIHQPLHSSARIDNNYPDGDKGGNMFAVPNHYGASNLHAVWDAVVYEFHVNPHLPFSDEDWNMFSITTNKLKEKHPLNTLPDTTNLNPNDWEQESFQIASNIVYEGISENTVLPQDYIDQTLPIAERQIVTAGYRLANLLKSINLDDPFSDFTAAPKAEVLFLQK